MNIFIEFLAWLLIGIAYFAIMYIICNAVSTAITRKIIKNFIKIEEEKKLCTERAKAYTQEKTEL